MRAYLPRSFQREAESVGIDDEDCRKAIEKAAKDLIDANLGAGLIKQRIPRGNQGAARGARAVVFYKRGKLAVFLQIFPKSSKANLTARNWPITWISRGSSTSCQKRSWKPSATREDGENWKYDRKQALPEPRAPVAS